MAKKRKTVKRTTRVVYVKEEPEDSLDRTMRTVGNVAVLGMGIGLMGAMMGGMHR
jgi:hypothetical protein